MQSSNVPQRDSTKEESSSELNAPVTQKVIIHLGAHKTASTHFHQTLQSYNKFLKTQDTFVARKLELREFQNKIYNESLKPSEVAAGVDALSRKNKTMFLSDENILGIPKTAFNKGLLYPKAYKKLKAITSTLSSYDLEICMAIRNQKTFAPSLYAEYIRGLKEYMSPGEYLGKMENMTNYSWLKLIRRIRKAVGPDVNIKIWRFEDYREKFPEITKQVLGMDDLSWLNLQSSQKTKRPGLSDRALQEIRMRTQENGSRLTGEEIDSLMEEFPKSEEFPAPQIFDDKMKAKCDASYEYDMGKLEKMENLTII